MDPDDLSTFQVDTIIDATTFSTNDDNRDTHVKSPDFLDVAQFPTLEFKSTTAKKTGGVEVKVDYICHFL